MVAPAVIMISIMIMVMTVIVTMVVMMMRVVMARRMLVIVMMQPLARAGAARILAEDERFDGYRHGI
jgi:hypothetical protein